VKNNEISTIIFSMNPIYGREKSDFLFASYVTKHPNAYQFTFILANEKKRKKFQPILLDDFRNS
jgi:hypothetical protein